MGLEYTFVCPYLYRTSSILHIWTYREHLKNHITLYFTDKQEALTFGMTSAFTFHELHIKTNYTFLCLLAVLITSHSYSSLRTFKYVRDNKGEISQCVVDVTVAAGSFDCAHKAGMKGSYAYVYVAENKACHICLHSREVDNRSLEHLPISEYPVYQRGIH